MRHTKNETSTTTQPVDFTPLLEVLTTQERIPVTFFVPTLGPRTATVVVGLNESPHTYSRKFGDEECPEPVMTDFWKLVDRGWTAGQINTELHRRARAFAARRQLHAA